MDYKKQFNYLLEAQKDLNEVITEISRKIHTHKYIFPSEHIMDVNFIESIKRDIYRLDDNDKFWFLLGKVYGTWESVVKILRSR